MRRPPPAAATMRINGHAHIFNLQTVLTAEAIAILLARLKKLGVQEFVAEALADLLQEQLVKPEFLVEDELLRRFLRAITRTKGYKQFVATTAQLPVEIQLLGDGVETLAVEVLRAALDKLSTRIDEKDALGRGVHDVFEVLRIAMQPDIVSVADRLLGQMRDDDALVALMMDIVARDEKERDRKNFRAQLRGTADAALQRPGRILPFVAVNPIRPDHFTIMKRAIEEMGFLGVKLYPSLGYRVDTGEMAKVLDYCVAEDVPVLMHTTRGGFFKSDATVEFGAPALWRPLLTPRPGLRLCFAHCGGWGGFSGQEPTHADWSDEIFRLMDDFEQVYADLSYHVEMMGGGPREERYLEKLVEKLDHPTYRSRIIFGTDSWLVRFQITEESYWRWFETKLGAFRFAQIAEKAPAAFLGLPVDGRTPGKNVERHVRFLARNRDKVGAQPTQWVRDLAPGVAFLPGRSDPRWSPNNRAHSFTYQFLRFSVKQIPPQHHALRFEGSARLRLRQLGYFRKGQEDDAIFAQRVAENARNLDTFMRFNGATYEGDFTTGTAREQLVAVFNEGDRTLADLAATVDAIYLFPTEVA